MANPQRLTHAELLLALAMVLLLASCVPAPTPEPTPVPELYLGGRELHFPVVMSAPYRWQRVGYGRPWQSIGKDPELHRKGMWAYSWGLGACLYDVPMVFSDRQMPTLDQLAKCNATSEVLLAFNEPEWASQANMSPEIAAKTLRHLEQHWAGEIWCCGNLVGSSGWLDRMMTAYQTEYGELPRLAGVHLHIYLANGQTDVPDPTNPMWLERNRNSFAAYLAVMRKWGIPPRVVVSECCLLGGYTEAEYLLVQDTYMTWLRGVPEIESVAWFSARYAGFPEANLLRAGGTLTEVGQGWLDWRWR
jgi:hypothetical protein